MSLLLVLADAATDATAVRLTLLARRRGRAARLVAPEALVQDARWAHRVDGRDTRTVLTLRDGTRLADDTLGGVFNRLWAVPEAALAGFAGADRDYARSELHALFVSWLAGLGCPVVNRATPHALFGAARSPARWQPLAHAAGFATAALRYTSSQRRFPAPGLAYLDGPDAAPNALRGAADGGVDRAVDSRGRGGDDLASRPSSDRGDSLSQHATIDRAAPSRALRAVGPATLTEPVGARAASLLVVGRRVWPEGLSRAEAAPLAEPCRRLAAAAGLTLVRVHLVSAAGDQPDGGTAWRFAHADPVPDVAAPGPLAALLDATLGAEPDAAGGRPKRLTPRVASAEAASA